MEKQHKTHPLVVLVVLDLVLAVGVRPDAGLHDVLAHNPRQPVGDGERRVNPTVSVHHVEGNLVDDAVDGVADVLARRDQQRECNQHDHRRLVMQAKYIVVDAHLV